MAALMLLFIVLLFAIPAGERCYDSPREIVISILVLPAIAIDLAHGIHLNLPIGLLCVMLVGFGWLWSRSLDRQCSFVSIKPLVLLTATLLACYTAVSCVDRVTICKWVVIAGTINACISLMQYWRIPIPYKEMVRVKKCVLFKDVAGKKVFGWGWGYTPIGMIGNTNFLAVFLTVAIMLNFYLISVDYTGLSWCFAPMVLCLLFLRCINAIAGFLAGLLSTVSVPAVIVTIILCAILFRNKRSFRFRIGYIQEAFVVLKDGLNWLYGVGFNSYKAIMPLARRKLLKEIKSKSYEKNFYETSAQLCHNDYVQALLDGGIVWLACILTLFGSAFFMADGWMRAAVVSCIVMSIALHNIHILSGPSIVLFLVMFMACSTSASSFIETPFIPVALAVLVPLMLIPIKDGLCDIFRYEWLKGNEKARVKALKICPTNSDMLSNEICYLCNNDINLLRAFEISSNLLANYDGEHKISGIYYNMACIVDKMMSEKRGVLHKAATDLAEF